MTTVGELMDWLTVQEIPDNWLVGVSASGDHITVVDDDTGDGISMYVGPHEND